MEGCDGVFIMDYIEIIHKREKVQHCFIGRSMGIQSNKSINLAAAITKILL